MKESLERIFSEENLLDYGRACVDVALDLSGRNIDTLLIPSRGAFPIFLGVVCALRSIGKEYDDVNDAYRRLNPIIPVNGWLEKYLRAEDRNYELPSMNILFTPFTADLKISEGGIDSLEVIRGVRDYWAKVTRAFFMSPEERKEDPYFRSFTEVVLKYIENRPDLARRYESFPQVKNLGLIDTVISGRASATIIESMDEIGLNPYSILIVDDEGKKLRTPFKQTLDARVYAYPSRANMVKTKRIVSEDEGAALEGVIALVYPSLMIRSLDLRHENRNFLFGAGSWHYPSVTEGIYSQNFGLFMKAIEKAVEINCADYLTEYDNAKECKQQFDTAREVFLEFMDKHNLLRTRENSVTPFNLNPDLIVKGAYETSSHVLHVPFDRLSTERVTEVLATKALRIPYHPPQDLAEYFKVPLIDANP